MGQTPGVRRRSATPLEIASRDAGGEPARERNANDSLAVALGGEIIAGLYPPGSRLPAESVLLERDRKTHV